MRKKTLMIAFLLPVLSVAFAFGPINQKARSSERIHRKTRHFELYAEPAPRSDIRDWIYIFC